MMPTWQILVGDVRERLKELPDASVHCCVTSPPYYGLRDYGTGVWEGGDPTHAHDRVGARGGRGGSGTLDKRLSGAMPSDLAAAQCSCGARHSDPQIGLEESPQEYVAELVALFREVRRVLRDDGTLWLNLGDSYSGSGKGGNPEAGKQATNKGSQSAGVLYETGKTAREAAVTNVTRDVVGVAPKNLIGIPWRVAFALQADGWYLRNDIIWHKPNPMPESVTDRCTKAHEYIFLLSKSERYYFDAQAIAEPVSAAMMQQCDEGYTGRATKEYGAVGVQDPSSVKARIIANARKKNIVGDMSDRGVTRTTEGLNLKTAEEKSNGFTRNKRTVWTITTQPYAGAHFATFPEELPLTCLKAGTSEYGCCASCGAPWQRVVEHQNAIIALSDRARQKHADGLRTAVHGTQVSPATTTTTTGWRPSCDCDVPEPAPCTVMDPFAGSGTTGFVALQSGRSFIGCELNPAYADLARARIGSAAPLFAEEIADAPAGAADPVDAREPSLF